MPGGQDDVEAVRTRLAVAHCGHSAAGHAQEGNIESACGQLGLQCVAAVNTQRDRHPGMMHTEVCEKHSNVDTGDRCDGAHPQRLPHDARGTVRGIQAGLSLWQEGLASGGQLDTEAGAPEEFHAQFRFRAP